MNMGITRVGLSVAAAVLLVGVMLAGPVSAGGMGGYNPGDEGSLPGALPRATQGTTPEVRTSPTASESAITASDSSGAGGMLSSESMLCAEGGRAVWWGTIIVIAAGLLWFGRRTGTRLWLIVIFAVVWFLWAWMLCRFDYAWLPVLLGAAIWLLSVPRPGDDGQKK